MEILAVLVVIAMAYMESGPSKPLESKPVTKVRTEPTETSRKVDRLYTSAKYLEDM